MPACWHHSIVDWSAGILHWRWSSGRKPAVDVPADSCDEIGFWTGQVGNGAGDVFRTTVVANGGEFSHAVCESPVSGLASIAVGPG
jgi:hypothetical protein